MYNGQFNQDNWVDDTLGAKQEGIFLDIGGCRPIKTNNTYFFEKQCHWKGVIVEANQRMVRDLRDKRDVPVINKAIWDKDGEEVCFVALDAHYSLSTLMPDYQDEHTQKRAEDRQWMYGLETITISNIFDKMGWTKIDYISLDVEGAEYRALLGMDQERHSARCITVEHNQNGESRDKIHELLDENYYRVPDSKRIAYYDPTNYAHKSWFWNEDWYILR